jgi:hypothetical protein
MIALSCNDKTGENTTSIKRNKLEESKNKSSDTIQIKNRINIKDTIDIPIGDINGYELVYNSFGEKWDLNIGLDIYFKRNSTKKLILKPNFIYGDYTVDEVSLFKHNDDNFIYIGTSHTYGHYQGYLYYLNTKEMKTYEVKIKPKNNSEIKKFTDTLKVHKFIELTKDYKNNLGGGETYFGKYKRYYCTCEYTIKKIRTNKFVLLGRNYQCEEQG